MKKTSDSESIDDVGLSKERLAEVGKKGFEQMERIKPSDLGEFSE